MTWPDQPPPEENWDDCANCNGTGDDCLECEGTGVINLKDRARIAHDDRQELLRGED